MKIQTELKGEGLTHFGKALATLGSEAEAYKALRRGVNTANNRVYTQVKRSLAKQVGAPQRKVIERGAVRKVPAKGTYLNAKIIARGGWMPLKDFGARQTNKGVSAAPWGKRQLFSHTFLVKAFGDNVFVRSGAERYPLKKLMGPQVSQEMVQGDTARVFQDIAARTLKQEVERQIEGLASGAFR